MLSLCNSLFMDPNPQNSQPSGNSPPPELWEREGCLSGPAPFKPPSEGCTSDVVESSGTAKPGEIVSGSDRSATARRTSLGRPLPMRPWEQNYGNSSFGGYGSTMNYNSGYGYGTYGSYGGVGGLYGGDLYGNNMYRGGYGRLYGAGMYGGGMYNSGFGSPFGGYGQGGDPYGAQDPNNPCGGAPPSSPGFWISFLRLMQAAVYFFARISILMDQNTQAFHLFTTALLQLFDGSGLLYGELARFVLRLLGFRIKPKKVNPQGPNGVPQPSPHNSYANNQNYYTQGANAADRSSWGSVWESDANK